MNKEMILNKLAKIIKERSKQYQKLENKEVITYHEYRKLLNELLNIIKEMENIDD